MEVDKESYEAEKGFHNWLINIIYKEFVKLNAVEAFQFQKMIIGLKFARNKADYKNEVIDIDQAKKASEISASTKSLLLKSFHS